MPDLNSVKRVLIIRLSSIGDVVHALPVAAALRDSFPHLELTWIVEEMSADIVSGSPCLDNVIVIPRNRWKKQGRLTSPSVWREYFALLKSIRRGRFDVTLDLQGYAKSALLALASGAPYRFGWHRLRDGAALVSKSIPRRAESVHRVDQFLDVPRAFGAGEYPTRFPFFISPVAQHRVRELLKLNGLPENRKFAAINPAVGSPTRKWSADNYGALASGLARRYQVASVLVGSEKDREVCCKVRDVVTQAAGYDVQALPLVDLSGQTNIKELAALLDLCCVHVCGDTGSAHIAAALDRPVVALYGPTDPLLAGPWRQSANVLAHREHCIAECGVRRCAVTGTIGVSGEPGVARCLSEISTEEVLRKVGQVLGEDY